MRLENPQEYLALTKRKNPCATNGTRIANSIMIRIYMHKGISYASGQSDHFYSFRHILVSFLIAFLYTRKLET